jgi:hypothetical protein
MFYYQSFSHADMWDMWWRFMVVIGSDDGGGAEWSGVEWNEIGWSGVETS